MFSRHGNTHAPRLIIKSPEKRCGKSRLLDIIEATCYAPLITVNASPAAVYRAIGGEEPRTLLVDEADAIFGTRRAAEANEELRALLNAGHQRGRPAIRWDVKTRQLDECETFAMAALAGIGHLPDTIEDRGIGIDMRRRTPGEQVSSFRSRRDAPPLYGLRAELHEWLRSHRDILTETVPELPVEDRAADTWEPLVVVADLAGGDWPRLAREACKALTAETGDDIEGNLKTRLLADCRTAFEAAGWPLAIASKRLLELLTGDADAPWREYGRDGLSQRKLGTMLTEYGIRSQNIRFTDGGQAKGYLRLAFEDAWSRYVVPSVPTVASQVNPGTEETLGRIQASQESIRPALTRENDHGTDGTQPPQLCVNCDRQLTPEQARVSELCQQCLDRVREAAS